jgi:hypothetical protein
MKKWIKIILIILCVIILAYILYPKDIGFIENGGFIGTLGEYSQCLGIKLSHEVGNRTDFRCIGIPFGKTII